MIEYPVDDYISVWIGTSNKSIDDFNEYTDGMEGGNGWCQACIDFGVKFIDSDFFVAYGTDNNLVVPVEELAEEIDVSSQDALNEIIHAAKEKGVFEGNSLYYYAKAKFFEEEPGRLYNDLKFIGFFYDSRKKMKV